MINEVGSEKMNEGRSQLATEYKKEQINIRKFKLEATKNKSVRTK
jgi:hypothetical protein